MKTKMGRPKLPKGQSKDVQIGVRFKPDEDSQIEKAIADSGGVQTKAQWVRDAARLMAYDSIICEDYSLEELDGKTVTFKILWEQGGPIEGGGTIMALQRGDGSMKIQIESRNCDDDPDAFYRFLMPQAAVPWLKKLPKGSKFDFSVIDSRTR
jgi:hypothetical protein